MPLLNDKALSQRIKDGNIDGVYLFYGHDIGSVEKFTHRLCQKLMPKEAEDLNLHRFNGRELDLSALRDITDSYPMFCERTLVTINDLSLKDLKKNDLDFLKETLKSIDSSFATVIIYITGIDIYRTKKALSSEWASFSKFCQKIGSVCEFELKTASELSRAIIANLNKAGITISPSNASYLAQLCLCNTVLIQNELSKLAFYKTTGEITKEDIDLLCVGQTDTDSFKLANEIVSKNAKSAYKILSEICRKPDEYIATLSSVNMAFVDLYRAKLARSLGATEQNLQDDFSYPANLQFRARNAYRLCKNHSLKDIRRCLMILSAADSDLKSKRTDPKIIFQTAIAKIAGA